MLKVKFGAISAALYLASTAAWSEPVSTVNCYPDINPQMAQYIVGYGSLLDTKSKNQTYKQSGDSIPVTVDGYQRGWISKGPDLGYSSTFLGVKPVKDANFNGVVFQLMSQGGIAQFDHRQHFYCRVEVPMESIHPLSQQSLMQGQYWIYVPVQSNTAPPSSLFPITESYVDIFLTGCIDIQNKFHLQNFAENCIDTTTNWSTNWVNDRINPRRPLAHQPKANMIDTLLSKKLPKYFDNIQIE